ncbi:MAG: GNAT family N-acetyltransferase [Pseudomonadota bacterium]
MTDIEITPTVASDLTGLAPVVEATGLFPPEYLHPLWEEGQADGHVWRTATRAGQAVGLAFAGPEPLTEGCWNMRALCVTPDQQGHGIGRALVRDLEGALTGQARLLLAETSGTASFATARAFYTALGYARVAEIPEFCAEGDAKVIFARDLR